MIDLHLAARRAIGVVTSVVDDQLGLPTPCPDASVCDLIDHIGVFAVRFAAAARKESDGRTSPPPRPSGTNLEPGWRKRISRDLTELADAWQDPQAWQGTTFAGGIEMPGEVVALDELIIHGWDIAVASGQPFELPSQEIESATTFVTSFGAPRDGRLFGPIVAVADQATARPPSWPHRPRSLVEATSLRLIPAPRKLERA